MLTILAMVIFAAMFVNAQELEGTSRFLPSAIAVFGMAAASLECWNQKSLSDPIVPAISLPVLRSPLSQFLWISGFAFALVGLGVLVAVPCYLVANFRLLGGYTWRKSILVAMGTTGTFFLVFTVLLDYQLSTGLIFESL